MAGKMSAMTMNPVRAQRDFAHQITRRAFLIGAAAANTAARAIAQSRRPTITVRKLNQVTLIVSDLKRSLEFYQGLFGMAVMNRQGSKVAVLQVGAGLQGVALWEATNVRPGIHHFCMTVQSLNIERILKTLDSHRVTKSNSARSLIGLGSMEAPRENS
jgi:hypothetical protein